MEWLVASIVASVVLTAVLNLGLRAFPRAGDRAARRVDEVLSSRPADGRRVQVWFPWKGMIVASLGLTVVLNLVLWLL